MDALDSYILASQQQPLPELTPRDLAFPEIPNKANVVVGMRRSGKTYLLYQEMRRLAAEGVDRRHMLYINFEDDRLEPLELTLLGDMLETFFRLEPTARTSGAYLFFDEIQNVPGWSRFARRVLDTETVRLYVSGSSAKLLHTEVATEFRGRGFAVELLPFSYREALRHAGIDVPTKLPGSRVRSLLEARLLDYLTVGGFPEVQSLDERLRVPLLQDYVELVLMRDVIERHSIGNVHAARAFTRTMLQANGRKLSVNKAYGDLKSRGVDVGKDTLYALLEHLGDGYLVFTVPVFKGSHRARLANPRKVYAIDPGLAYAMSHTSATDLGLRLEGAVYLELRRQLRWTREGAISYHVTESGREVDFVVGDSLTGHAERLVQVCADASAPETRDREVRALAEAMAELGLAEGTVVTLVEEETLAVDAGTISLVPAWRWMLGI